MQQQAKPRLAYGVKKAEAARRRREQDYVGEVVATEGIFAVLTKFFS